MTKKEKNDLLQHINNIQKAIDNAYVEDGYVEVNKALRNLENKFFPEDRQEVLPSKQLKSLSK
jgi:hypothetical protein